MHREDKLDKRSISVYIILHLIVHKFMGTKVINNIIIILYMLVHAQGGQVR